MNHIIFVSKVACNSDPTYVFRVGTNGPIEDSIVVDCGDEYKPVTWLTPNSEEVDGNWRSITELPESLRRYLRSMAAKEANDATASRYGKFFSERLRGALLS